MSKVENAKNAKIVESAEIVEIRIEGELDDEARGVSVLPDGSEFHVAGTISGEVVRVEVAHVDRRGRRFARLLEVIEPSASREGVSCPHFLRCGGCDLLHASRAVQHAFKRARVARALQLPLERVDEVVKSPREFGYRALAKFVVGRGPNGAHEILGSYRPRSHDVTDMRGCLVHAPEAEAIAESVRSYLETSGALGRGARGGAGMELDLRYVLIRASLEEKRSVVILVSRTHEAPGVQDLAEALGERSDVALVALHVNASEGDEIFGDGPTEVLLHRGEVVERIGAVVQTLGPGAFAQINPGAARELYRIVVDRMAPQEKRIVDLYAGSGGLSLSLAHAGAREVVAIEESPLAIDAARRSAESMGIEDRVEFLIGAVEERTEQIAHLGAEGLVLNPPRKGASPRALRAILGMRVDRVVYVSCNPDTLARDLEVLKREGKLEIARVTPVDLFPHTRHVETVVSLARGR